MVEPREHLARRARVRAGILRAHLSLAAKRWPDVPAALRPHLDAAGLALVEKPPTGEGATLLFSDLVRIDRALAQAAGGDQNAIFHALGIHSAEYNLKDVYGSYEAPQPHEFFKSMSVVHRAFQDFGKSTYEVQGERAGRIRIVRYKEYSPVFCAGGSGYYEQALRMMKVPGPIEVRETACHCTGDDACVFDLRW